MNANILVDTNVLVYAYDRATPDKQRQAITVVDTLVRRRIGVITTQVLAEFFVAVTRKIAQPLSAAEAGRRIDVYVQTWTVLDLTGMIVLEAARGVDAHQLSFWDAQIWAAARLNQIALVFSEDFNVGATIEGVRFINPFGATFRLDDWLSP